MSMEMHTETAETVSRKKHTLVPSDQVEGTAVCRPNGERIGTIQRVMIDKVSGNVAYAVLSFGGFLGIGQKHLPIPWSRLKYDIQMEAYQVDVSDDELKKAPAYEADKDFDWGDRSSEIIVHRYYGARPYWGAF